MKITMAEKKEKFGKEYFILQEFLMQKKVDLEHIGYELDIMLFVPRESKILREDMYMLVNEGIEMSLKNPTIKSQKIIYLSIIWSQNRYIIRVNDAWQPFGECLNLERKRGTKRKRIPFIRGIANQYDGIVDIADEKDIFSFWVLLHEPLHIETNDFLILAQIPYTIDIKTVLGKDTGKINDPAKPAVKKPK